MIHFITYTTGNYTDFTLNLLINFQNTRLHVVHHIIVVCLDDVAIANLQSYSDASWVTLTLWEDKPESLALYADFGTANFNKITHQKMTILRSFLTKYEELYYVDSDIVFFKDPESMIRNTAGDLVFQQDAPFTEHKNIYHTYLCSGNFFLRRNKRTTDFIEKWFHMLTPNCNEQETLYNYLKSTCNLDFRGITEVNLGVFPMEMAQNGYDAFRFNWHIKDEKVCIHANHMIGAQAKMNALKSINMWFLQ